MNTRRSFIVGAGGFTTSFLCGCAPHLGSSASYSVPILGDIHFDSTDAKLYHSHYTHSTSETRHKAHLKEHKRNARIWKERMPALVRASAKCVRTDAAFALQLGDLVQGDCGNASVHKRMLDDAFAFLKGAYGGLPVVSVVGNHDIRGDIQGDGALETFHAWQPPIVGKELGVTVNDTTFSFRQGPDAYIIVDFNEPRPDFAKLVKLLSECEDARYVFVVTHGPFIPNGNSRWLLLGTEKRTNDRIALTKLLARRNAIVLAGHTHCLEYYDCEFPEGRITQLVANSMWTSPELAKPAVIESGAAEYGKAKKGYVDEFRPFVKDYLFANAAGHYVMDVSDDGVSVSFFGGSDTSPSRVFKLRGRA